MGYRWHIGDWYGAHEVAHNLQRYHAEFCNARGGRPFPNPNGSISPITSGPNSVFGFDLITGAVYGTDWTENMGYCPKQWTSDFTVNGIMTFMQQNLNPSNQPDYSSLVAQDSLLVIGTIQPSPNPTYFQARQWGAPSDKSVVGDYDGDGIADLVIFRPGNATWYIQQSSDGIIRYIRFGLSTDIPV